MSGMSCSSCGAFSFSIHCRCSLSCLSQLQLHTREQMPMKRLQQDREGTERIRSVHPPPPQSMPYVRPSVRRDHRFDTGKRRFVQNQLWNLDCKQKEKERQSNPPSHFVTRAAVKEKVKTIDSKGREVVLHGKNEAVIHERIAYFILPLKHPSNVK